MSIDFWFESLEIFQKCKPRNEGCPFIGKKRGKSNILVFASGLEGKTQKKLTAVHQIKGIEVKATNAWWSLLLSNSLTGVIVGALLTFIMTRLGEHWRKKSERQDRKRWITGTLPALLQANRAAIAGEHQTSYEAWMSKLLAEGYYADLRVLSKTREGLDGIARPLIEIGAELDRYEKMRLKNRISREFRDGLAARLDEMIEKLDKL